MDEELKNTIPLAGNEPSPREIQGMGKSLSDDDLLVHMTPEEEETLSQAQGGRILHPELNMPYFSRLNEVINSNPKVKEAIDLAFKGFDKSKNKEKVVDDIHNMLEKKFGDLPMANSSENLSPEANKLQSMGEYNDSVLCVMPKELLYYFWDKLPEGVDEDILVNKKTGLPQFFWASLLKGALSIVGGVVGTIIAPGFGTAIGSGLGSMLGSRISNTFVPEEEKESWMQTLGGGLLAGGLGYLGGGAYSNGLTNTANSLLSGAIPESLKYAVPALTSVAAGSYLKENAENERNAESFGKSENKRIEEANKERILYREKEQNRIDKYNEEMAKERAEQKALEKEYHEQRRQEYARHMAKFYPQAKNGNFRSHQMVNTLVPIHDKNGQVIGQEYVNQYLNKDAPRQYFKKGGIVNEGNIDSSSFIKGDSSGQEDNIHVDVPKGSYVIDAATVSHLGDGNSLAGKKILDEFVSKFDHHEKRVVIEPFVPCALSSGEYVITREIVELIGKGNIDKGHAKLKAAIKKIREDKGVKKTEIPKPAKHIFHYLREKKINNRRA